MRRLGLAGALCSSLAFAFPLALNLVLTAALPTGESEGTDFGDFYEPVARSLLAGRGYPVTDATSLSYPPGFPLVLAGVYQIANGVGIPERQALSVMMALCMGTGGLLIFLMGRELWDDRWALGGALAWSTYPLNVWLGRQPNSEVIFLLPYYGAVYLILREVVSGEYRYGRCFLSGLLTGAAMLVRPIAIGLGLALAITVWVAGRRVRGIAISGMVLLAGASLAVLPWEAFVYARTDRVVVLSTNGPASIADGLTYAVYGHYRVGQHPIPPDDVLLLMGQLEARIRSHPGSLSSLAGMARLLGPVLVANPEATAKLLLLKGARAWYATDSGHREIAILAIQLAYIPLLAWSSLVCGRSAGRKRLCLGVLLGQLLYFWAMTVMGLSIVRYLTPAIGLMFLLVPGLANAPSKDVRADDSATPVMAPTGGS